MVRAYQAGIRIPPLAVTGLIGLITFQSRCELLISAHVVSEYSRVRQNPLHMLQARVPREHVRHRLPTCTRVSETLGISVWVQYGLYRRQRDSSVKRECAGTHLRG